MQKDVLVLTYKDLVNEQWHMLMPNEVLSSLASEYKSYLQWAEEGLKLPSKKELRMMEVLRSLRGED